ncbi:hypothetical protein PoB_005989800 [Plakobranchus ocellatus]|uniref:Uncharacterized protein n=1 Tax=Plakobranchus ocellatus TaxID=259542 RepID=A0AAV4CMX9_9GAST|nr:hypothetical protein PoB_005989800 [Plakobranchus ocellatus]
MPSSCCPAERNDEIQQTQGQHARTHKEMIVLFHPHLGELRLSGTPSGQGASSGARTRDRSACPGARGGTQTHDRSACPCRSQGQFTMYFGTNASTKM